MTKSQNTKSEQLKEQINKCCLDAITRGTANTVKEVKEFGMPERIKELVEQNAELKELLARAKGIITAYRLTGNQDTYSDNDMKECVAKIDEVLR